MIIEVKWKCIIWSSRSPPWTYKIHSDTLRQSIRLLLTLFGFQCPDRCVPIMMIMKSKTLRTRSSRSPTSLHAEKPRRRAMPRCNRCNRDFINQDALKMHRQKSPKHYICQRCNNREFLTKDRLEQHWANSAEHDYCEHCRKNFANEYDLTQHYRQSPRHYYCHPCNRHFTSHDILRQHLKNALVHQWLLSSKSRHFCLYFQVELLSFPSLSGCFMTKAHSYVNDTDFWKQLNKVWVNFHC